MITGARWFNHDGSSSIFEADGYEVKMDWPGNWSAWRCHGDFMDLLGEMSSLKGAKVLVERDMAKRRRAQAGAR